MRGGVHETAKQLYFKRLIGDRYVKVTLNIGWIWIEEEVTKYSIFHPFGKKTFKRETYTVEDARNLVIAIQELLPKQETDKQECRSC